MPSIKCLSVDIVCFSMVCKGWYVVRYPFRRGPGFPSQQHWLPYGILMEAWPSPVYGTSLEN